MEQDLAVVGVAVPRLGWQRKFGASARYDLKRPCCPVGCYAVRTHATLSISIPLRRSASLVCMRS